MNIRSILLIIILFMLSLSVKAEIKVKHYNHKDGLNEYVYDIRQDSYGLIWLSTHGGLYSYNGRQFVCHIDSVTQPPLAGYDWMPHTEMERYVAEGMKAGNTMMPKLDIRCSLTDKDGNLWIGNNEGLWMIYRERQVFSAIDIGEEILCLFQTSAGDILMTTRNGHICRLDSMLNPIAYLTASGRWTTKKERCGYVVMQIVETTDRSLYLAARQQGLLRLSPLGTNITDGYSVSDVFGTDCAFIKNLYAICPYGNDVLWTASLKSGLGRVAISTASDTNSYEVTNYNKLSGGHLLSDNFRCFTPLSDDRLLAGSDNGIYLISNNTKTNEVPLYSVWGDGKTDDDEIRNSCILSLLTFGDNVYIGTSGGGLSVASKASFISKQPLFTTYTKEENGLPSNVIYTMAADSGNRIWGFCDYGMFTTDPHYPMMISYKTDSPSFSIGNALLLPDGRMLKGTLNGIFSIHTDSIYNRKSHHEILLQTYSDNPETGLQSFGVGDTLILPQSTDNIRLGIAVLDYRREASLPVAYRCQPDSVWEITSEDKGITIDNLPYGYTVLEVCSANSYGNWFPNNRNLVIYNPYPWMRIVIMTLGVVALVVISIQVWLFIKRRMPVSNQGTDSAVSLFDDLPTLTDEQNAFRQQVRNAILTHLDHPDFTVGYLAELLNMSHNSLITKIRENFGQKPIELITAIRMQAAQEMLQKSSYSVSEIAYRLGYNDPKYFARVYKKVIGKTPTESRIKTE